MALDLEGQLLLLEEVFQPLQQGVGLRTAEDQLVLLDLLLVLVSELLEHAIGLTNHFNLSLVSFSSNKHEIK